MLVIIIHSKINISSKTTGLHDKHGAIKLIQMEAVNGYEIFTNESNQSHITRLASSFFCFFFSSSIFTFSSSLRFFKSLSLITLSFSFFQTSYAFFPFSIFSSLS